MKRIIAILLSVLMVLALFTTAFAENGTTKVTFADTSRTYNGYKLLDLTTSLKTNCGCAEGATHTTDCYNYAYTVNGKYRGILQAEVFNNAAAGFWGTAGKPTAANAVTDTQILDYLAGKTSDTPDGYGTLREVADRLYRAIKAANIGADASDMTATTGLAKGYWLIADVTGLDGKDEANSLVMLDTSDGADITVSPKTSTPTVEKKVKDTNNSTDTTGIEDNPWEDTADHDIGDKVPFKLTATLPSNIGSYETYKLVFHDKMSAGLTLDADSFKVYVFDSKAAADADADLSDGTLVDAAKYSVNTSNLTDGCTFEVKFENVKDIAGANKALVVYYEATLNADADVGMDGNPNEVYLEFSNNPYSDGTGKTEEDEVVVYTYQLVINKTDEGGNALEGATFTLYKKDENGVYQTVKNKLEVEGNKFTWTGLDDGHYKLVEDKAPDGYNKIADIEFTISAEHGVTPAGFAITSLTCNNLAENPIPGDVTAGTITASIKNYTGIVLPETGAEGTVMLISVSALVVFMAAVFMITRKKMSIYED